MSTPRTLKQEGRFELSIKKAPGNPVAEHLHAANAGDVVQVDLDLCSLTTQFTMFVWTISC